MRRAQLLSWVACLILLCGCVSDSRREAPQRDRAARQLLFEHLVADAMRLYAEGVAGPPAMATGYFHQARDRIADALDIQPVEARRATLRLWLGWISFRCLGEPEEAIRQYREALAQDPDAKRPRLELAAVYGHLSLRALRSGDVARSERFLESARGMYREMFERWPRDGAIRSDLGVLYLDHGLAQEAHGILKEAVDLDPDRAEAWANLGTACAILALGAEEEAAYRRAIRVSRTGVADAFFGLGRLYAERAEVSAAAYYLRGFLRRTARGRTDPVVLYAVRYLVEAGRGGEVPRMLMGDDERQ